ncbi:MULTISPECIES: hypothetical protein [unclassified Microbulbifer]|uniref:hypothetical protein n=1 Tax=unclassified Microbulbifer TaxID=2619833 RepID=UPI0027E48510|nr:MULTISPECIES: hypothetical protein [unclassified Microbulbifer]
MRIAISIIILSTMGCATYNPTMNFTRDDLPEDAQDALFAQDKGECVDATLSVFGESPVYGVYSEPYRGHDGGYYSVIASTNRSSQLQKYMKDTASLNKVKIQRDTMYLQCMETRGWRKTGI